MSATTICRWVNENGRTQISEVVPDKYKKVATCTDSQKIENTYLRIRVSHQKWPRKFAQRDKWKL